MVLKLIHICKTKKMCNFLQTRKCLYIQWQESVCIFNGFFIFTKECFD
jgi:hypothetical protein